LIFPGIFRGLLDAQATVVTTEMKLAAAQALAHLTPGPTTEAILSSAFDSGVMRAVAKAVFDLGQNGKIDNH